MCPVGPVRVSRDATSDLHSSRRTSGVCTVRTACAAGCHRVLAPLQHEKVIFSHEGEGSTQPPLSDPLSPAQSHHSPLTEPSTPPAPWRSRTRSTDHRQSSRDARSVQRASETQHRNFFAEFPPVSRTELPPRVKSLLHPKKVILTPVKARRCLPAGGSVASAAEPGDEAEVVGHSVASHHCANVTTSTSAGDWHFNNSTSAGPVCPNSTGVCELAYEGGSHVTMAGGESRGRRVAILACLPKSEANISGMPPCGGLQYSSKNKYIEQTKKSKGGGGCIKVGGRVDRVSGTKPPPKINAVPASVCLSSGRPAGSHSPSGSTEESGGLSQEQHVISFIAPLMALNQRRGRLHLQASTGETGRPPYENIQGCCR
ncbi:unnamed protein product [Pleuronectes platessa]|uniref:Uncharacterized protein n=1 Tax=Pleuronectes platessa TaxID=8262 RepID=A0A9N7YXZ7_PLEPL|nr:unnamed protein product [Pleuronectes platessa]